MTEKKQYDHSKIVHLADSNDYAWAYSASGKKRDLWKRSIFIFTHLQ
jgi:hypothetical protein